MNVSLLFLLALLSSLCLADKSREPGPVKVFVACGWHGREWATADLCRAWDARVKELSARATRTSPMWTQWYIIPEVNPSGIKMARDLDMPCHRGNANGVDLNRNFPAISICPDGSPPAFPHNMARVGRDAEVFSPFEFSEAESRSYRDQLERYEPDIVFNVHTGAEAILFPLEACFEPIPRLLAVRHQQMAWEIADILRISRTMVGHTTAKLGPAVGTATDYAYVQGDVPFAYTLETYETPLDCSNGKRVRGLRTANMTDRECRLSFVPHSDKVNHCRTPDLDGYIARWVNLVDAVEQVVARNPKERSTLAKWLDKELFPASMGPAHSDLLASPFLAEERQAPVRLPDDEEVIE